MMAYILAFVLCLIRRSQAFHCFLCQWNADVQSDIVEVTSVWEGRKQDREGCVFDTSLS
jgi:hypothetical protein